MPDSEAKKRWMKENSIIFSIKLMKRTEADLIEFLEGKVKGEVMKTALREYIENHKED